MTPSSATAYGIELAVGIGIAEGLLDGTGCAMPALTRCVIGDPLGVGTIEGTGLGT